MVMASVLLVNKVLIANANVANKIIIGNCVNVCTPKFANIFISSIVLVLKLYATTGSDKLSNPKIIPPIKICITSVMTIMKIIIINVVIAFAINILFLVYGFTNNSFIVPLLNSSLTIVPAIITTTTIKKIPNCA